MSRLPIDVKVFRYTDPGAPQLTGAAGSIVELLKAALVDGYGTTNVTSVTRDGSTVTVTIAAGHSFPKYGVIELAGAAQTDYNGLHRIESVTTTTFTFTLPDGVTPASPATGTITVKMAPAGWSRPYTSADNLRMAFRSTAPEATGFYLYVDDTNSWTRCAGAKGYELMTDIDSRTGPFPYSENDDQWVWWYKSDDNATARKWALVADASLFYLWVNYNNNNGQRIYAFGDMIPIAPADLYCCVIQGHSSSTDLSYCGGMFTLTRPGTTGVGGCFFAKDCWGTTYGISCLPATVMVPSANVSALYYVFPCPPGSNLINAFQYPDKATGKALSAPIYLFDTGIRALLPGVFSPLHVMSVSDWKVIGSGDEIRMALNVYSSRGAYNGSNYLGPQQGVVLVDIIGPWR